MRRMVARKCVTCGGDFQAIPADVRRGWGKTCSKRCAAKHREKTNTPSRAQLRQRSRYAAEKNIVRFKDGSAIKLPANVSREQFIDDMKQYGGTPQYDRQGNYEGFTMSREEAASGGYGDSYDGDGLGVGEGKDWF